MPEFRKLAPEEAKRYFRNPQTKILTEEFTHIVNTLSGRGLEDDTTIDSLYGWNSDRRYFLTRPPQSWKELMESLEPSQKNAISGALWAAKQGNYQTLGELRETTAIELRKRAGWVMGEARTSFLLGAFSLPEVN